MTTRITRRSAIMGGVALGMSGLALPSCAQGRLGSSLPPRTKIELATPDGRVVEVSQWKPEREATGYLVFSHGWEGSPDGCLRLIEPLARAGWHVLAPLHTDSKLHPKKDQYSFEQTWPNRLNDMQAISQLIGDTSYVAAGHSFGALTALTLGGVSASVPDQVSGPLRDKNVRAVLAFSPPLSIDSLVPDEAWATLAVPALIQTGTRDNPSLPGQSDQTWEGRLISYHAPAAGNNLYALVLEGVDHNFGGGIGSRLSQPDALQDKQLDVAADIAELFVRAFGKGDTAARTALNQRLNDQLPVRLMTR